MNYRHIFHAGNISDVVKHAVWVLLLEYFCEKDKGFFILDTHAGGGLYDLADIRAEKTGEAQQGVLKFLRAPSHTDLASYQAILQGLNPNWIPGEPSSFGRLRFYPGSPLLAAKILRPQDRLSVCELHAEDADLLKNHLRSFSNVQIHHRDGYEAMRAFLPPIEKRGIVLIDPPYELPDEFDKLTDALMTASTLWPQGAFVVWYPIKDRAAIWRFHEKMIAVCAAPQLCAEFIYEEETRHDRLNGCGLLLVNPPWKIEEKLHRLLPFLHKALETSYQGVTLNWLKNEEEQPD